MLKYEGLSHFPPALGVSEVSNLLYMRIYFAFMFSFLLVKYVLDRCMHVTFIAPRPIARGSADPLPPHESVVHFYVPW